ncbi:MAG: ABC transporter permease [Deltaproteobacteria bacterium]|nr:ABC transporter permease [Deltaproteobacteria bacterium]
MKNSFNFKKFLSLFEELGMFFLLCAEVIIATFRPPYRIKNILKEMDTIGIQSLFVVLLTGAFTGMVMALQSLNVFAKFNAEGLVGSTVAISVARELGPVLSAFMVTGRAGSAMSTELGSMRVTEQIDALYTMGVDPKQYLIVPKVIAGIIMLPILTAAFNLVSVAGSYFVAVILMGVDAGIFIDKIRYFMDPVDIISGLIKAAVFGYVLTMICTYNGFYASGGAKGVGEATTRSVVVSFITILIVDYFLTVLMTKYLPGYVLGG